MEAATANPPDRKTSPAWLTDIKHKLSIIGSSDIFGIARRSRSSSGHRSTSTERLQISPSNPQLPSMSEAPVQKSTSVDPPSPLTDGPKTIKKSALSPVIQEDHEKSLSDVDLESPSPQPSSGERTPTRQNSQNRENTRSDQKSRQKRSDSPIPGHSDDSDSDHEDAPWLTNMDNARIDTLDLQNFGPWEGLVPVGRRGEARGHEFQETSLLNPTWCDKCGDFIWGFTRLAVRCAYCHYTCHTKCKPLVRLDCRRVTDSLKSNATESTFLTAKSDTAFSDIMSLTTESTYIEDLRSQTDQDGDGLAHGQATDDGSSEHLPTELPVGEELHMMIAEYNSRASGLEMTLNQDSASFRGFIRIHMNFSRPINVVAGERPPTIYDIVKEDATAMRRRTITSFFLPRNTVKVLHTTSDTTTQEMIVALLKKFKVADNPRKFALYERNLESGKTLQAKLRRISDYECPLRLYLLWGHCPTRRFVLQENESGDVAWDAFEIPELQNFLRILEREEELYIYQIRRRYELYQRALERELRLRGAVTPSINNPLYDPFAMPGGVGSNPAQPALDPFGMTGGVGSNPGHDGSRDPFLDERDPFASADRPPPFPAPTAPVFSQEPNVGKFNTMTSSIASIANNDNTLNSSAYGATMHYTGPVMQQNFGEGEGEATLKKT